MLNGERHKRARKEGYEAGKLGKGKNPYSVLGAKGQVYSALWDAGYSEGVIMKDGTLEAVLCYGDFKSGKVLSCSFEDDVFDGENTCKIFIAESDNGYRNAGILKDGKVEFYASDSELDDIDLIESGLPELKAIINVFDINRGAI